MADFKACVTFYNRRTTVKQKRKHVSYRFDYQQSDIVPGACAFNVKNLYVSVDQCEELC